MAAATPTSCSVPSAKIMPSMPEPAPGSFLSYVDVTTLVRGGGNDLATWFKSLNKPSADKYKVDDTDRRGVYIAHGENMKRIAINALTYTVYPLSCFWTKKPLVMPPGYFFVATKNETEDPFTNTGKLFIGKEKAETTAAAPAAVPAAAVGGAGLGGGSSGGSSASATAPAAAVPAAAAPSRQEFKIVPELDDMPIGSNTGFVKVTNEFLCGGKTPLAAWFQRMRTLKAVTPGDPTKEIKISYEGLSLTLYEPVNRLTLKPFAFPEGYIFLASRDNLDFYVGPKPVAATAATAATAVPRRNSRRNRKSRRNRASRNRSTRRRRLNRR